MRATAVKYVLTQRLWNLFCRYSGIVKTYYATNERQIVSQTFHDLTCCSKVLINTKIRRQKRQKKYQVVYLAKPRKITYTKRKKKLTRDLK